MGNARCARAGASSRKASKPKPMRRAQYLELSEELQTRYGLPRHPSCSPDAEFAAQADHRLEIDALINLLPHKMRDYLLSHDTKFEVRKCMILHIHCQSCSAEALCATSGASSRHLAKCMHMTTRSTQCVIPCETPYASLTNSPSRLDNEMTDVSCHALEFQPAYSLANARRTCAHKAVRIGLLCLPHYAASRDAAFAP